MAIILALDQSTSATKALLFDEVGTSLGSAAQEHRQFYPKPGWVEHDAEEIYQDTIEAVKNLLAEHPVNQADLLCLCITSQRETIVVFEKGSGQPSHPAIVWQCRRGEELCTALESARHGAMVQQLTGLKIDTYFPASRLTWLFENHPDLKARVAAGDALIDTIDNYLIYRLTGGAVPATDHTNACRTLLFDIHDLNWHQHLCAPFSTASGGTITISPGLPMPVSRTQMLNVSLNGARCTASRSWSTSAGTRATYPARGAISPDRRWSADSGKARCTADMSAMARLTCIRTIM